MLDSSQTHLPGGAPPQRQLRLTVLGGLSLTIGGTSADDCLAQPKRVAVLIYLAVRPGVVIRRETLLAMFWPEFGEHAARAALSQALSFLRRSLGEDRVESRGASDLRLRPEGFTCDVPEFETALDVGDLDGAIGRYAGPLLPGFAVAGADGFNDWLDRERDRLRMRYLGALERLAVKTEQTAGARAATELWERLATLEPLSDSYAAGFIKCLAATGHRDRAIRHAESHRAVVQAELSLGVGPEVQAAVAAARRPQPAATAPSVEAESPWREHPAEAAAGRGNPPAEPRTRRGGLAPAAIAVLALALFAAVASRPSGIVERGERVLVLTFAERPGQEELAGLGELVSGWIIDGLVRAELPVIDPASALRWSRGNQTSVGDRISSDSLIALGRSLRVSLIVSGAIDALGDSTLFTARVLDARSGTIRDVVRLVVSREEAATRGVQVVRNQVVGMISSSRDRVLLSLGGKSLSPPSLPAYRHFVAGMERFQKHEYDLAAAAMLQAARIDTTFVTAALWAKYSAYNAGNAGLADSLGRAISQLLQRQSDRLSPLERFALESETPAAESNPAVLRRALVGAARLAPGSNFSYLLGALEASRLRWHAALEQYLKVDANTGWALDWDELAVAKAFAFHMTGRLEAELPLLRSALLVSPSNLRLRALEVATLGILGRTEEFRAAMAAAEQLPERQGFNALRFYHLVGMELFAHGIPGTGREVLVRATDWMARHPEEQPPLDYRVEIAVCLEDWVEAEAQVQRLIQEASRRNRPVPLLHLGVAGSIAARLGRIEEARSLAWRIAHDSADRPVDMFNPSWGRLLARAWIATSLGERDSALELLSGIPGTIPDGDWVGRHAGWEIEHAPLLASIRSDPRIRRITRRP